MGKELGIEELKELYYYTSSDTMRYILTNANIFATNLKYMNDKEEYVNGLAELCKLLNKEYGKETVISDEEYNKAIREQTKSYSISFSHERNLLSQWSMYAKESGVSIRMDFSKDFAETEIYELAKNNGSLKVEKMIPYKVYYLTKHVMTKEKYEETSKELMEDLKNGRTAVDASVLDDIQDGIYVVWRALTPYVKRKEFFQEAEYRLVFNLNALEAGYELNAGEEAIRIDYRVDRCVLKPYLDVKRLKGWPVKEIIVGPGANQTMVFESIRHFLDNAKIEVPFYEVEDIKELGNEFLKRLDEDENIHRTPEESLSETWTDLLRGDMDQQKVIVAFNDYIAEQKERLMHQGGRVCLTDYIYMSPQGIILSISETPFLY